jgi:hypothetical protein
MYKKLYEPYELLDGTLQKGMVAETVNLGEDNYKIWFNPETSVLEYKDYPDQQIKIVWHDHPEYPTAKDSDGIILFRIYDI